MLFAVRCCRELAQTCCATVYLLSPLHLTEWIHDLAVLSQAGSGGAGDLHAALAAERAACEELRGRISDKEALMVLKKTLAEEKEAAAALRRKLG